MMTLFRRMSIAAAVIAFLTVGRAEAQSPSARVIDPFDIPRDYSGSSIVAAGPSWQTDPFNVGYNLLGGYRTINVGARQAVAHELVWTGPNGYVYRPIYSSDGGRWADGGSRRLPPGFGPLIIDFPGSVDERRYAPRGGDTGWSNVDVSARMVPEYVATPREF